MVMGHVYFGSAFDKYIHAFHMPMWFIISGYFINVEKNFRYFLLTKIRVLLVPFFLFSLSYEITWSLLGYNKWSAIVWPNSLLIPLNGALWFLPAMFFADIIGYMIIRKYYRDVHSIVLICVFISFIGTYMGPTLPFSFDSGIVGASLLLIGYLLRIKEFPVYKGSYLYIVLIVSIIMVFINGGINVRLNKYAFQPLFYINAVLSTIVYWNIAKLVVSKYGEKLAYCYEVGKYSLLYVCINEFLIVILRRVPFNAILGKLASRLLEVIIILTVCFLLNRVLLKSRFRFIIGK